MVHHFFFVSTHFQNMLMPTKRDDVLLIVFYAIAMKHEASFILLMIKCFQSFVLTSINVKIKMNKRDNSKLFRIRFGYA